MDARPKGIVLILIDQILNLNLAETPSPFQSPFPTLLGHLDVGLSRRALLKYLPLFGGLSSGIPVIIADQAFVVFSFGH